MIVREPSRHRVAGCILAATVLCPIAAHAARDAAAVRAEADTLHAHSEWAPSVKAYEELVRLEPANASAWYRIGSGQAALARWDRAIAAYRRAESLGIPPALARYNVACSFARAGRPDSALATLEGLVGGGYSNVAQLESDEDLATIRPDARFAGLLDQARRNATPCAYAHESRQFDFWIGDWDVRNRPSPQTTVGESHVELILGQCVIFENWTSRLGGAGKSLNAYNPETKRWQQNWMDAGGRVTNYGDGKYENGAMTFLADGAGPNGEPSKLRLTFHNLGPDQVRQHGEISTDGGATWSTTFDLLYLRRTRAAK